MPIQPKHPRLRLRGSPTRGQAELIGGLIVLTILFVMAAPLLLSYIQRASEVNRLTEEGRMRAVEALNEKVAVAGVPSVDPDYPAVWINNTGTVTVKLEYMYLIDTTSNRILYILDLKNVRNSVVKEYPELGGIVRGIVYCVGGSCSTTDPPKGLPITLPPGAAVKVLLNGSNPNIQGRERSILVRVESVQGVIHPILQQPESTLEPGRRVQVEYAVNLTDITAYTEPRIERKIVLPGYLVIAEIKEKENVYISPPSLDPKYPPFNIYTVTVTGTSNQQRVYVYRLNYPTFDAEKIFDTKQIKDFTLRLGGAYMLTRAPTSTSPGSDYYIIIALATEYSVTYTEQGGKSSLTNSSTNPYLIIADAPQGAISLLVPDPTQRRVFPVFDTRYTPNITIPDQTLASLLASSGIATLSTIGALNLTRPVTLGGIGETVVLVNVEYELKISFTSNLGGEVNILSYRPPLIAVILKDQSSGKTFYAVQPYDAILSSINGTQGSSIVVSWHFKELLYGIPPGDYWLYVVVFDALPNAWVNLTVRSLSIGYLSVY